MTEPIQRRGEWWQESPTGRWLKWNEATQSWDEQAAPPPPPDSTPADSVQRFSPPTQVGQVVPPETHGSAIGSLVLGILWLGGVGSLIGLVLGVRAKREIDQSAGLLGGRGIAVAGIVLGWIGLAGALLTAALLVFAGAVVESQSEKSARAQMESAVKNAATAEESYLTSNPAYSSSVDDLEQEEGLFYSSQVVLEIEADGSNGYCIEASHENLPGEIIRYDSDEGQPQEGPCN